MLRLFFFLFLTLYTHQAFACKCVDPDSIPIEEAISKSTAIFIGEVISIANAQKDLEVKFDVLTSYKGIDRRSYISVRTARTEALCGYPFKVGERYLVFTYGSDILYTSLCTRTAPLNKSEMTISMLPKPLFSFISETDEYTDMLRRIDSLLREIEKGVSKYKDEGLILKIKDARIILRDYAQSKETKECRCPACLCPPCPHIHHKKSDNQLDEEDFANFTKEFKKASTDSERLRLIESLINSGVSLKVSQVISLLKNIDFSSDRKKFFTIIKGHISDPQNIYQIYNHLDFESERDEAKRILESR